MRRVVETQFEFATEMTAPHFFAEDAPPLFGSAANRRLLGLSMPYAPAEGGVRHVGEKISEMASSAPEAQPDLAVEAAELVGRTGSGPETHW